MANVTLFLCGDVMTGRGVDQILGRPSEPTLHEPAIQDARRYVDLAEQKSGPIPRPVDAAYVWGDALALLDAVAPDARVINLETSVTRSDDPWRGKDVHYRMHPDNVSVLTAAAIDVCVLANNHVLDFGRAGLLETLETLHRAGLGTAGAGPDLATAQQPAVVELGGPRLLVFGLGSASSGIPLDWAATPSRPGVDLVPDLSQRTAGAIADRIATVKGPHDLVVASIHWGSNWGYEVPAEQRRFAHALIDAGVAIVHGHSSHHPRPLEVYRDRLIQYGCGDCIDDYEGIGGFEAFRSDLALLYLPELDGQSGALVSLRILPMQLRKLALRRASAEDAEWSRRKLERVSPGCRLRLDRRTQALVLER